MIKNFRAGVINRIKFLTGSIVGFLVLLFFIFLTLIVTGFTATDGYWTMFIWLIGLMAAFFQLFCLL